MEKHKYKRQHVHHGIKVRWQILGDVSSANISDIQIDTALIIVEHYKPGSQDQMINGVWLTITDFQSNKTITQHLSNLVVEGIFNYHVWYMRTPLLIDI